MTPSDDGDSPRIEQPRKPYVAPRVIFSELYAKGVGAKLTFPQSTDYHSASTTATS
jgi:hypothetical protein